MILTRKQLDRRTLLKGFGAALGLPFLDAMVPALARASAAVSPARLCFVYAPTGMMMNAWTPVAEGSGYEMPRILKPLEPFRDRFSVLTGLVCHNGNALEDGAGDHARAGASYLTGVHPRKTMGADIQSGISADQVAAASIGSATRLRSLELGCEDARTVGNCDSGYSCAYTNSISWRTPTTPMPPEINPRMVFERLFGTLDTSIDPLDRASVLDAASESAAGLMRELGPADRRKMDEYMTGIREIERKIQNAESDNRSITATMEKPAGIPQTFSAHAKLMYDLQAMAFQTGLTRVTTFMYTREGSPQAYPEIGITDGHHPLSHHRNNPENIEKLTQINTFHVSLFAGFLDRLQSIKEPSGSLLDNTMIIYGSGISDPNKHLHENLPVLVAGNAAGAFKSGRHIVYKQETPVTNLYLTALLRMGVQAEKIGDSNGELRELTEL